MLLMRRMNFFCQRQGTPYIQSKSFGWIRGYQTGGRSLIWVRIVLRWSYYDFEGSARMDLQ